MRTIKDFFSANDNSKKVVIILPLERAKEKLSWEIFTSFAFLSGYVLQEHFLVHRGCISAKIFPFKQCAAQDSTYILKTESSVIRKRLLTLWSKTRLNPMVPRNSTQKNCFFSRTDPFQTLMVSGERPGIFTLDDFWGTFIAGQRKASPEPKLTFPKNPGTRSYDSRKCPEQKPAAWNKNILLLLVLSET